ncbi:AAEL000530-PA, partial [Aedes aegypti]
MLSRCGAVFVAVIVLCGLNAASVPVNSCIVEFGEQSRGRGISKRTFNGNPYCEFLGIRYAEPPAGALRFEVGNEIQDDRNFTKLGSICPQVDDLNVVTQILGDEDCLFLDVYRPAVVDTSRLLPVLVFVHGGSFSVGSSTSDFHGVDLLIDHEIIIVSIQYRLDQLGFLRSDEFNISGNFGLKDQRTALRWVQQYIQNFGGDPQRVTLMGHSAGAAAVTYHLYSENSKGLFHQAFALGGSMLAPWAFLYDAGLYSHQYFKELNITSIEQMKSVDFKSFWSRDIVYKFATVNYGFCVPSAELDAADAVVTRSPQELIRSKPVNDVPLLFGQSSEEFELFLSYVDDYWMGENFPNFQNETLKSYIDAIVDRAAELAERSGVELDKNVFYLELANTANWFFPNKHLLEEYSKWVPDETYFFRFQFDGKFGWYKKDFHGHIDEVKHYGAIHGDELGYIFTPYNVREALANRSAFRDEWRIHEQTVQLVASFIKYGSPNYPGSKLVWPPYNGNVSSPRYLNIDKTFEIRSDQWSLYHSFWGAIYQCLYHYNCNDIKDLLRMVVKDKRLVN